MHYFTERNIYIFLIQIFLLLGLARSLGELFRRWKQPALTAEIIVGIILGPTILGRLMPKLHSVIFPSDPVQQGMLQTVAWLGLLFFLLETGLKMDFSSAWRHRGNALKIALTDIMVPMCLGFMTSFFIPDQYLVNPAQRVIFSLFMATVMTISAMPITARALADLNVAKTDLGFLIMSALSVNEILGWIIFTIVIGTFIHIAPDVQGLVLIFSGTLAFTVICLTLGRKFANRVITITKNHGFPEPGTSLTFICLMGFLCGAIFQKLGVHALLGFFVAGVMVGEARELPERTRQVISQMVYALFIPLFFTGIGLGIDFLSNFNLFLALFVTVVGVAGKFLGAWIGLRFTNVSKVDRLSVAIAHTPGGSMEIVIGMLALQYNLISKSMFVAIVFGAVLSAVILGPWLRYSLGRRKHVSILELFSKRQLVADIKADSKESALYELCAIACSHHNMPDPDVIYHAVMDRESLMSTAIEEGIALPHARIPGLNEPIVVFGRSIAGFEWDSPDGKLTKIIFLILTPVEDDNIQLQILRIISTVMSVKATRKKMIAAPDMQIIWDELKQVFSPQNIVRR